MNDHLRPSDPVVLSLRTVANLPARVAHPRYDRGSLSPGIVHIGVGNFHRAHQAWYLHQLMQAGQAHDWAIIGAGVRSYDAAMREKLMAQDCLTTLIELDPASEGLEVTGSMIGYLPIEENNGALIAQMADPAIRIVSMTVTEGGYYLTADGGFDLDHPDICNDMKTPNAPITVFGAIVAALRHRRAAGLAPFTALSCDNLQSNGDILRQAVIGLAHATDPDLAWWIAANGAFPNSMVDCIVPATAPDLIAELASAGIADAAPVSHEAFRQWVIEDAFCNGRPPWEEAGATLTDDVHAYEAMKLRILNGGHQLLANAGELLSVDTIAGCMEDTDIKAFFLKVQREEVLKNVASVPTVSPEEYLDNVVRRFANPKIHDTTRRVAFDGSSRHPGFLLPSLRNRLAAGASIDGLALAEALWARMCAGTREDGSVIAANDPEWDSLQTAALAARETPGAWLAQHDIYADLAEAPAFQAAFARWLVALWADGTRSTLAAFSGAYR
ncbi:MAG: mannitol dehydrogenase family protein [Pseudomonadota bacterium]